MQIVKNELFTILIPDKGYKIINKTNGRCFKKVYLGKNDSVENYGETVDEKYINMDYVVELDTIKDNININNKQNDVIIDLLLLTLDEMYISIEPILSMMPMTMNDVEDVGTDTSKFVLLYKMMIDRELKTIDEIPERFKNQINKL